MKKLNQVQNLILSAVVVSATAVLVYMMSSMWQQKPECNNVGVKTSLQEIQVNMLSTKLI